MFAGWRSESTMSRIYSITYRPIASITMIPSNFSCCVAWRGTRNRRHQEGITALWDGRPTLWDGRPTLWDGRPTLWDGRPTLWDDRPALRDTIGRHGALWDGIPTLWDGIPTLWDGISVSLPHASEPISVSLSPASVGLPPSKVLVKPAVCRMYAVYVGLQWQIRAFRDVKRR